MNSYIEEKSIQISRSLFNETTYIQLLGVSTSKNMES